MTLRGQNIRHGQDRKVQSLFWPVLAGVLLAVAVASPFLIEIYGR